LAGEYSLSEILTQIERQTKNQVSVADRGLKDRRLSVDWGELHFWDCLDDLCHRAHLRWQLTKDDATIRIFAAEEFPTKNLAVQRTGPFRIAITNVEIRAVFGDDSQRVLRVRGRMSVEPRLRPLFLSLAANELTATTDGKQTLPAWNPDAKYEFPIGDGGRDVAVQWDFRLPATMRAKAVSISGRLHCQIAAATERVVFDQKSLVRGTVRRRGGVSVRLRQVAFEASEGGKLNGDIGITVSYDNGGPAFESHRSWIFHNAVYLETKAKVRTNFTDFDTNQQSDGAVAVDYRWKQIDSPSDQYLFVYEAPTLIIDVPVNVDLVDIPLME
jgi:hypothetical protein